MIGQKKADIAQMIGATAKFTVQDVKDEIAKCEVRCGNCHQKKTTARAMGKNLLIKIQKSFRV
jgi:cytochrome c556